MDIRETRTRAMLRDALKTLLVTRAYDDISVSEICELSTVRRATFYRHFKDKDDFYEWYLQTITEQFLDELDNQTEVDGLEEYASLMHRRLIEFTQNNRASFSHAMGKFALAGSIDMVANQAARGITDHIVTQTKKSGLKLEIAPEIISMFYTGGVIQTLRWWITNDMPVPAEDLERMCTEFLLRYLGLKPDTSSPHLADEDEPSNEAT